MAGGTFYCRSCNIEVNNPNILKTVKGITPKKTCPRCGGYVDYGTKRDYNMTGYSSASVKGHTNK